MATKNADPGDETDGAALFSMDDLRARLDAPLFHRDPGLSTPAQLPRLRELPLVTAVEETTPAPAAWPAPAPKSTPVVEPQSEPDPSPNPPAPPVRPMLVSFSDMLSTTGQQAADVVVQTEPAVPEPETALPEPARVREPFLGPPQPGNAETEALLAVLSDLESLSPAPAPAPAPTPSVEDELNRLAFLPDQEAPVGRVDLPSISHTEARDILGVPVLSQHEMYNPRAMVAPTAKSTVFESAFDGSIATKRRKKGLVKRFTSLVLLLALLGGGAFAAKYYLLDAKWDPEVEKLAQDVEASRRLQFGHAVEVTTLSADEYASQIARHALAISGSNEDEVAGKLRALGLLSGALDLRAVGLAALPDTPAFYDFGSDRIYVVEGLPVETYRFAMYRALATALLDQEFGWGSRIGGTSLSVIRGTRALYEADALATASAMLIPSDRASVLAQRAGLFTSFGVPATPTQFGTAVAGRLGLSLRAFVESIPQADRVAILDDAAITDGQALDLRRLVSITPESTDVGRSEGNLFWYHVLASRLDPATAWNNALQIHRDDVVVAQGANGFCVSAVLTTAAAALDGVNAAFLAWASTAPVESTTTVIAEVVNDNGQLSINACDPGPAAQANSGLPTLSMGGAPLRSEQYRLLVVANPALPRAQAACAVYGGGNVSINDERPVLEGAEGWLALSAHAPADPNRAGCEQA